MGIDMYEHFYAVIMAGGGGTRLWPLSRKARPKQMLRLLDERSLFQTSVERLAGLFPCERIFVVTVAEQAEELKVPIYLHPADLPLWSVDGGASFFGLDLEPLPPPGPAFEDGMHLHCGALDFEVLHLPGHTPGHVGLLESAHGWLFSGDVLFAGSIGRTDLPGGDYATLMDSIRNRLLPLPDSTLVYSGHGPETTIGRERRSNPFITGGWG